MAQGRRVLSTDPHAGQPVASSRRVLSTDPHAGEEVAAAPSSASGRFLSNAAEVLNPVTAIAGMASAVRHPVQAVTGIARAHGAQIAKARQAYGEGRMSEAVGHAGAALLPIIGPAAAEAGEQIGSGDVAGGLGKAAGLITGAAVAGPAARATGRAVRAVTGRTSTGLYQSALKPTKAVLKDVRTPLGAGPDAARSVLVQTGLKERIPISKSGAKKVDALIESLNTQVEAKLAAAAKAGKTVDPAAVEQEIASVAKDFTNQINAQPDLSAIETVKQNFRSNPNVSQSVSTPANWAQGRVSATTTHSPQPIPVLTAQQMKVQTYRGLKGKYGVERGATIEAEKAGARGLREQIELQAPEVGPLNAREGAAFPLEHAIADAMRRRGNYGIFGLTPIVAAVPAVAHGNLWPLLASMVDRMPGLVSRTAIAVHRAGRVAPTTGRVAQRSARATTATNAARFPMRVPATAEESPERRPPAQGRR